MDIGLKLLFPVIGNISKWIYSGGKKSIDEVSKEDNLILGMVVSFIICVVGCIGNWIGYAN